MANLIGTLYYDHHDKSITRLGHKSISAVLRTWEGNIEVVLNADGSYTISVNGDIIKKGNTDKQ